MTRRSPSLRTVAFIIGTLAGRALSQELTDEQVWTVRQRLGEAARLSWELGTRAQVIIEYDTPEFNVLSTKCSFPLPSEAPETLETPLDVARQVVSEKPDNIKPFFDDGSAADPASIGAAVLIANWTGQDDQDYARAAEQQLDYLLNDARRTAEGAISHRNDKTQLWSDYVYMVPPFFAFYGAVHNNATLLEQAFEQCRLYRDALRSGDAGGLWKHIVGDSNGADPGHWATGNAWAAMGMLRVAGTMRASQLNGDFGDQQGELISWVEEIVEAMYSRVDGDSTAIFRNYVDQGDSFRDGASTALMAAVTYRLAVLTDGRSVGRIGSAERARKELSENAGNPGAHIDDNGWLTPVVNPHNFVQEGRESAEGQAFIVSMQAGYRAWKDIGSPSSAAVTNIASMPFVMLVYAGVAAVGLVF